MDGIDSDENIGFLSTSLGAFGFQWVCACAVFPELSFDLSVAIGVRLARTAARPNPSMDEHHALFKHRWFREGFIPDTSRAVLVSTVDPLFRDAIFHLAVSHCVPPSEERGDARDGSLSQGGHQRSRSLARRALEGPLRYEDDRLFSAFFLPQFIAGSSSVYSASTSQRLALRALFAVKIVNGRYRADE